MDSYPVSRPDFGAWLKQIIKAAGVPLTELSRLSGIAYPNLNAIVNSGAKGKPTQPEEPTMVKLITALIALNIIEDENDAWIEAGYRPKGYTLAKESDLHSAGFATTDEPTTRPMMMFLEQKVRSGPDVKGYSLTPDQADQLVSELEELAALRIAQVQRQGKA